MPYVDIFWNYEDDDGNVAHIAEHGLTSEDVNAVLMSPDETGMSRSSGRPIAFGYTPDGRYICVVYEKINDHTLYPVPLLQLGSEMMVVRRKVRSVNKKLTEEERQRHRHIREQIENERSELIARGKRAKARHDTLRQAVATLKAARESLGDAYGY